MGIGNYTAVDMNRDGPLPVHIKSPWQHEKEITFTETLISYDKANSLAQGCLCALAVYFYAYTTHIHAPTALTASNGTDLSVSEGESCMCSATGPC